MGRPPPKKKESSSRGRQECTNWIGQQRRERPIKVLPPDTLEEEDDDDDDEGDRLGVNQLMAPATYYSVAQGTSGHTRWEACLRRLLSHKAEERETENCMQVKE